MPNNSSSTSMQSDRYFAEMLNMMREQGRKDNPVTLQLGIMQSENSVKIDDLTLYAEDLYIADYLVAGYTRKIMVPYVSKVTADLIKDDIGYELETQIDKQDQIIFADGLKKGDLVAVQKLQNTNKYVILVKVVEA